MFYNNGDGEFIVKNILRYILVFMVCFFLQGCDGNNVLQEKPVQFIQVKSEDMINDYIRDQGSSEKKYKNRNIKLTGNVLDKGQFKNSSNFFVVTNSKYAAGRNYSILIEYPVDRVDDVNKLKQGDFLVAEGACVGIVPQDNPTDVSIQIKVGKKSIEKIDLETITDKNKLLNENTEKLTNGIITGTDVRIREAAGTNSKILGYFMDGEVVTVLVIEEDWYQVSRNNGQIGWVYAKFCKI